MLLISHSHDTPANDVTADTSLKMDKGKAEANGELGCARLV
jgi:hypothetical protein